MKLHNLEYHFVRGCVIFGVKLLVESGQSAVQGAVHYIVEFLRGMINGMT